MIWKKLGQLFKFSSSHNLLCTHAANPLPIFLHGDVYRIFYSGRDVNNRSSVSYVDIDILKKNVVGKCLEPKFVYGKEDSFYSHGVSIGNAYVQDKKCYILFMGWNIPKNEHWRGDVGRLELSNNEHLSLTSNEPFMGMDEEDKISLSYPFVTFHDGVYKMWYGSTIDWTSENGEMVHVIKYATSLDGDSWTKHGIAIPYEIGEAQAFSRPSVIIDEEGYHMWYSYRKGNKDTYRIGYSYSQDGLKWIRKHTEVGIDISTSGWDSQMICYPFVFDHKGERYMLYNGNEYGKYGFGLAKLD